VFQVVEFNSSSSLLQQLLVVKDTGVYVSVHTSNLANTPFLQPGSAVVEIIQVKGVLSQCSKFELIIDGSLPFNLYFWVYL
jgi:hypothetical protein